MLEISIKGKNFKELYANALAFVKENQATPIYNDINKQEPESTKGESVQLNQTTPAPVFPIKPEVTAPAVAVSGSVELDTDGLPWDARIHSSSKTKAQTGAWRLRRGLEDTELKRVWDQLRTIYPDPRTGKTVAEVVAESKATTLQVPGFNSHPVPTLANVTLADLQPTVAVVPPMMAAPAGQTFTAPPIPQPPTDKYSHSFESFRAQQTVIFSNLINDKKIDNPYIQSLCEYFKVANLWDALKDEASARAIYDMFVESKLITRVG